MPLTAVIRDYGCGYDHHDEQLDTIQQDITRQPLSLDVIKYYEISSPLPELLQQVYR